MASLGWRVLGRRGKGVVDSNTYTYVYMCVNMHDERWQWALDNLIDKSIALADYVARLQRPFRIKYLCIPPQPFTPPFSLSLSFVCVSLCVDEEASLWAMSLCGVVGSQHIKTYFHFPIHKYIILCCHTGIVVSSNVPSKEYGRMSLNIKILRDSLIFGTSTFRANCYGMQLVE